MLRIGICDDIYDARLVLRAALERVLEKRRVQNKSKPHIGGVTFDLLDREVKR